MPSPFPGMDPYLEHSEIWPGFHHRLANEIADQLNPLIEPKYYADIEVRIVHQFDNIENIKRAVEIGAGVSILPLDSVRREVDFGLLKAIPFASLHLTRPLGIVRKRGRSPTAAVSKFRDLLLEASTEEVNGEPQYRVDALNGEGFQTVIDWQDGDAVRVVLVSSFIREVQTKERHETTVQEALAAARATPSGAPE